MPKLPPTSIARNSTATTATVSSRVTGTSVKESSMRLSLLLVVRLHLVVKEEREILDQLPVRASVFSHYSLPVLLC